MKKYEVSNPKPGSHKLNLTGKTFESLTVLNFLELDKYKNKLWNCLCSCGKTCKVKTTYLRNGKTTSCGCGNNRKGKNSYNYSGFEDITGTKWNSIISNATSRNLLFNIDKEDVWEKFIQQGRRCALSNIPIEFSDNTASVDRIDNTKGYEPNNFIITHKHVNIMRNKFNIEYFVQICELIYKNN